MNQPLFNYAREIRRFNYTSSSILIATQAYLEKPTRLNLFDKRLHLSKPFFSPIRSLRRSRQLFATEFQIISLPDETMYLESAILRETSAETSY